MGPISWSVKLHKVEKACQRQTLAYWAHMYGTKEVLRVHEHSIVQVDVESYSACSISGCRRRPWFQWRHNTQHNYTRCWVSQLVRRYDIQHRNKNWDTRKILVSVMPWSPWTTHHKLVNGSFTLATFVSETVGDSNTWQSPWVVRQYLPYPLRASQQEIETILSVSCRPRWPRQVLFCVAIAGIITHTLPMETWLILYVHCPR